MGLLSGFAVLVIFLVVLAIVIIFMGVTVVPQGSQFTVERFGRYTKSLRPGLGFLIPFIDRVGAKVNMMEQVLDIPTQEVISRDNAMVAVDGVLFYQILDAAKSAYEVRDLDRAIQNLAQTNLRTVLGSMDLDQALSQRDDINSRLLTVIDQASTPWGIKVTRVEIKDITPPTDLVDAMARQMKAEREKRAVILEAEGVRQADILRAEGEKKSAILEAEGRKEAAFRDAEARERSAQAEAQATQDVSQAIAAGDIQSINYFVAQKYVEAMKEIGMGRNSKLVLMPMEASALVGSLGGIGQIAKEVFGDAGEGTSRTRVVRSGTGSVPESD